MIAEIVAVEFDRLGDRRLKFSHDRPTPRRRSSADRTAGRRIRRRRAAPRCRSTRRRRHHALGDDLQEFVAGAVAEAVVDELEIVEIDEHHRRPAIVARARSHRLRQAILEQDAVGQAGQSVVVGHEMDAIFGALALDRDAGDVGGDVDEARLGRGRLAHRSRIHRERAERLAMMREDRRRPAGAKAVAASKLAIVRPQRIVGDVGDDDGLAAVSGRAARARHWGRWRRRRWRAGRPPAGSARAAAADGAVLVEQQDGAENAAELQFDQPREASSTASKRRAHRDHFEDLRLGRRADGRATCAR